MFFFLKIRLKQALYGFKISLAPTLIINYAPPFFSSLSFSMYLLSCEPFFFQSFCQVPTILSNIKVNVFFGNL
jgi:hypothetical protein